MKSLAWKLLSHKFYGIDEKIVTHKPKMERKEIVRLIKDLKESAQKCADSILQDPALDFEGFDRIFTRYLCYKFMLNPAELTTDDFYEICQLSAEKSSSLPKGMLDAAELASKCGGATTAMNKKVLFLLNVNETYQITITAEESVKIETFTQLKQLIYSKLQENKKGS